MKNNRDLNHKFQHMSINKAKSLTNQPKLNLYNCVIQYRNFTMLSQMKSKQKILIQFCKFANLKVLFMFGPSGCGKHMFLNNFLTKYNIPHTFRAQQPVPSENYSSQNWQKYNYEQKSRVRKIRQLIQRSLDDDKAHKISQIQIFQDFPISNSQSSATQFQFVKKFRYNFFKKIQTSNCKFIFILNSNIYNSYYIVPKDCPNSVVTLVLKSYTNTQVKSILKDFDKKYPIFLQKIRNKGKQKDIIDQILQISGGDMRKVLLNIYKEILTMGTHDLFKMSKQAKSEHKFKRKNQQKFPLFHLLGKYLYAKRLDVSAKESRYFTKQQIKKYDPPFYFNPVQVFLKSQVPLGMFNNLLFENYLSKIAAIQDAKNISLLFCLLDTNFPFFIKNKKVDPSFQQSQHIYIFLLTWGTILFNKSSSKLKNKGMFSFKRSEQEFIQRQINSKSNLVKKYLTSFSISSAVRWGYIVRNCKIDKYYLIKDIITKKSIRNLFISQEIDIEKKIDEKQDPLIQKIEQQVHNTESKFMQKYNLKKKQFEIILQIQKQCERQNESQQSDVSDQQIF